MGHEELISAPARHDFVENMQVPVQLTTRSDLGFEPVQVQPDADLCTICPRAY